MRLSSSPHNRHYLKPTTSQIVLALLSNGEAFIIDLRKKYQGKYCLEEVQDESDEEAHMSAPPRCVFSLSDVTVPWTHTLYVSLPRSYMTVARFDPTGKHVFVGTSLGYILVFNTRTKSVCLVEPKILVGQ